MADRVLALRLGLPPVDAAQLARPRTTKADPTGRPRTGVITGSVYGATGIDSTTGASMTTGGDIAQSNTGISAAKTLGAALGIDQSLLKADFIDNGTVKPVKSTLNGITL